MILNSGGDLTLRGAFTQYYLEKLGFNNLFVSGCPSLFMRGANAEISAERVEKIILIQALMPMLLKIFLQDFMMNIQIKVCRSRLLSWFYVWAMEINRRSP